MENELEQKLAADFPFMKRKNSLQEQEANGQIDDLYGAFGCEVNNGWYELLHNLCEEITTAYANAGLPVDIIIDQVKEKFGTLRFYYHIEEQEAGIQAFDILGQGGMRFMPNDSAIHKEIAGIVRKWETASGTICEMCGEPGELRKDLPWLKTLCASCYTARKNKLPNKSTAKSEQKIAEFLDLNKQA